MSNKKHRSCGMRLVLVVPLSFSLEGLTHTIRQLDCGKIQGPDNIPPEFLIHLWSSMSPMAQGPLLKLSLDPSSTKDLYPAICINFEIYMKMCMCAGNFRYQ